MSMNPSFHTSVTCVSTMKLLGDFWTLRIIDTLQTGNLRFCELQRALENLNPVTLTSRLKRLEHAGIITRAEETLDKISVVYSLTNLGHEVLPVISALDNFAAKSESKYIA